MSLDRAILPHHRLAGHSNHFVVKYRFPVRKTRFRGKVVADCIFPQVTTIFLFPCALLELCYYLNKRQSLASLLKRSRLCQLFWLRDYGESDGMGFPKLSLKRRWSFFLVPSLGMISFRRQLVWHEEVPATWRRTEMPLSHQAAPTSQSWERPSCRQSFLSLVGPPPTPSDAVWSRNRLSWLNCRFVSKNKWILLFRVIVFGDLLCGKRY